MPIIAAQCRRTITLALMGVVVLELAGCTVIPRQSGLASTADNVAASNDQIRTQVFGNALGFNGALRLVANQIIDGTDDPEMRRRALRLKIDATAASQMIVAYHDPLMSILDLWAFTLQLVDYYSDGPGRDDFGPYQDTLVATLRRFPVRLQERTRLLVKDPEVGDGSKLVSTWVAGHPITTSVRLRPWMIDTLITFMESSSVGAAGAMGIMAERLTNISDRLAIYYPSMPHQMRWEGELFLEDLLERNQDLRASIDSIISLSGSIGRIADIAETGSPLIDSLLATVRMDARLLIAETLDSVDLIRLATMDDVDREIAMVLAAVQSERIAVMATIDTLTRARIDQSVRAVRGLMWIGIILGIVILVAPFILGLVVGRAVSGRAAPTPV